MRVMVFVVVLALLGAAIIGCGLGGGLSPEQQARVNLLVQEDARLTRQMADLFAKAKSGQITMEEAFIAVSEIKLQIDKNLSELKALKEEGASNAGIFGGVIGGILGAFFRTGVHAARLIPGPVGTIAGIVAPLLLGGSSGETAKKPPAAPVPAT